MSEFENIFEEANKKNGKEAPPPKAAPEATEKKSFADKMREKKLKCYEMIDEGCASIVANAENMQQFLDVQSRCENYSLSNNILIYMQMDGKLPTRLMDFDGWKKAGSTEVAYPAHVHDLFIWIPKTILYIGLSIFVNCY